MIQQKPFSLPEGIEAAAFRLAAEISIHGYTGAQVMVFSGGVSYIDVLKDGETHFLKLIDGEWCELIEVESCEQLTTSH